ncbi:MAG: DUF6683 family protein [Myxococcota bacterium]
MLRALLSLLLLLASPAFAQIWNSNAGGWNTGYGTVYGSFGLAQATQGMYNTMQMNLARATMRQAMINKWGLAAVEKAEREAAAGKQPSQPGLEVQPPRPVKNQGVFKPDKKVNTAKTLADGLGGTPEEKQFVTAIFQATKQSFEAQPETKAWRNNIAGALAFFLIGNITIYQGAEEPSDEASQALFVAINQMVDEVPEFGKMSNKDKQAFYDTLIGFTGIPLALATEANEKQDAEGAAAARAMSGELLKLVLKVDPAKLKIENGAFVFGK